jgi:hypothetical protein
MRNIVIQAAGVSKTFTIPSSRRDTVREHALDFFRPRRQERLRVLESVSFELRQGESLGLKYQHSTMFGDLFASPHRKAALMLLKNNKIINK